MRSVISSRPGARAGSRCAALLLLVAAGPVGFGQCPAMGGGGHSMGDMRPIPAPDQLPVPVKMTGIGNSHIAIKATPEAQAWFDQGLSLLHDFWDYESAKAFEQAIRADPACAMCQWGLAQALGMRGNEEVKPFVDHAMAEAERLKSHASKTDRLYIEAGRADLRHGAGAKSDAIPILRKLVKKSPRDIEARIFLAGELGDGFDENGEPKSGEKEKSAILEGILREAPNDSAANHYWIHAMEPGNHPERAIPSAALLATLAPTSGHMVHMPGHIYYRVGDYAEAERWFAASMAADESYLRAQKVSVDNDWNYVHNMMYAIANLMEQGKLDQANALSDRLGEARGQLSATLYIRSPRDQMARINRRLPVALRTADWDEVLALLGQANSASSGKTANLGFLAAELGDFATGMKALESGQLAEAASASDRLDAGLWRTKRDSDASSQTKQKAAEKEKEKKDASAPPQPPEELVLPDALVGPLIASLSVDSIELHAGLLVAQGRLEEGKKQFAAAIAEEKNLGYREPPFYIRPVGENEAAALLRAKDYPGANAAYEEALKERPHSGFPLYGIARARELAGDAAGARTAYDTFLKAWPAADPMLPEVVHARQALGMAQASARNPTGQ